MSRIEADNIVVFIGATGYGKSYLIKHFLRKVIPYWIIWDETGEYATEGYGYSVNTISQLVESKKSPMLTYHNDTANRKAEMEKFCFVIWKLFRDRAIIFEECDLYFNPKGMPRYGTILVYQGRHKNLLRIFAAKRIHTVNGNIIANANFIFFFQIEHENDSKTLRQFLGRTEDERYENVEKLKALPKHHYAVWDREAKTLTFHAPI